MKKLSFFLMAMLMSVMSFAAEYTIVFKSAGSDSNADLGATPTVSSVVSEGTSYVASFSGCAKIYVGVKGIKLGSAKATGTLNFNLATLCQENVKSIKVVSAKYGSDTGTLTLAVNGTNVKTGITPGTDYTHTYNAPTKVESIKLNTSSKRAYLTKVIITTEEEVDPNAVYYTITTAVNDATMGKAEGGGEYKENTKISLTATPNSGYEFVKWSNESTANPLEVTVTENATYTAIFQEQTPITCSQIKDLAIGDAFVLGEFTVTYVNGSYTYIKDATGASLIYASNYGLKAGDVVTGLAGTRANYNGLVQITPSVTKAQLTVTAGTAPQPEVATANPTQADMNKYVKYEQVTFDATAFSSKKINATLAGQTTKFAVYDQWNTSKTFVKGGTYEFIGAVSYYNAVQVNFISATKVSLTISATATGGKVTGTGEYMEGDEATLIATANEGYEFVNWTWADEVVCTTPEYTFEVEEAMSLVANFAKKTYTVTATAENGSVAGLAADGKYEHGAEANLTATANEGYEFVSWTEGEEVVSTNAEYTFEVLADRALVANFAVVEPEVIAYELNGGELPTATVPTQEELWASFKTATGLDTKALSELSSPVLNTIAGLLKGTTWYEGFDVLEWKWLKSYIQTIQANQAGQQFVDANGTTRTVVELKDDISSDDNWRFAVAAFFAQSQYVGWPTATADFTEAGKPEAWGAAYQAAHAVVLPTEPVAEDYVLPTPVKTGYTFVGWYDNEEGTGEAYTVIPAGWSGTLYAIWKQSPATALENIAVEGKAVKAIINGQLIIINNGVQYNAQGQVIR